MVRDIGLGAFTTQNELIMIVEKMKLFRVLLFLFFLRQIHFIKRGVEGQDFEAFGVGHLFIKRVIAGDRRLVFFDPPALAEVCQGIPEKVADTGVKFEFDSMSRPDGRLLAEIRITQPGHDGELIQIQGAEFIRG